MGAASTPSWPHVRGGLDQRWLTSIAVVRSASALGRNHRRSQRMLRCACGSEGAAVVRLLLALQDQPGNTLGGLLGADGGDVESAFGVGAGELVSPGASPPAG